MLLSSRTTLAAMFCDLQGCLEAVSGGGAREQAGCQWSLEYCKTLSATSSASFETSSWNTDSHLCQAWCTPGAHPLHTWHMPGAKKLLYFKVPPWPPRRYRRVSPLEVLRWWVGCTCTWAGGSTEFSRIIDQICWSCAFSLTYHVCLWFFDQICWAFAFSHLASEALVRI